MPLPRPSLSKGIVPTPYKIGFEVDFKKRAKEDRRPIYGSSIDQSLQPISVDIADLDGIYGQAIYQYVDVAVRLAVAGGKADLQFHAAGLVRGESALGNLLALLLQDDGLAGLIVRGDHNHLDIELFGAELVVSTPYESGAPGLSASRMRYIIAWSLGVLLPGYQGISIVR